MSAFPNDPQAVIKIAKALYAEAVKNGTVKSKGALCAATGQLNHRAGVVTWKDYLPEARLIYLVPNPGPSSDQSVSKWVSALRLAQSAGGESPNHHNLQPKGFAAFAASRAVCTAFNNSSEGNTVSGCFSYIRPGGFVICAKVASQSVLSGSFPARAGRARSPRGDRPAAGSTAATCGWYRYSRVAHASSRCDSNIRGRCKTYSLSTTGGSGRRTGNGATIPHRTAVRLARTCRALINATAPARMLRVTAGSCRRR